MNIDDLIKDFERRIINHQKRKRVMIEYLNLKLNEEDWHGVEDAASDIRDIEAAIKELEELKFNWEMVKNHE